MTPQRWAEVGRLFDAAQELPVGDRPAFLEKQCAGDPEIRVEVESLLASLERADSFLEGRPIGDRTAPAPLRRIGSYELAGEVGQGGMGVVYRALRRDQGFERAVAVKLVKRGMDTDFILRRFESERRILAGLDHPNIARVLDGGETSDGLPYFVMELIEGRQLLQYCEEEKLDTPRRLALFREVCSAVQYAHQRLVIHRDIKPSNILVTSEGVPKLLDFGLAKVLAREEGEAVDRTETALRVLTPEYASPEQIRGEELTTATDVYSLGVVLYELLTGERPYKLKTRAPEEVSDAVLHQEPAKPSTRARLHRDLDAIVMMALRKEPERRYATAEQLSEDIRRHLEGLPVKATPDRFGYRAGKFVSRHRLGITAAGLIAATLLGGLGISLRQTRLARRESAKAQQVSSFLRELFASAFPGQARGQKLSPEDLLDAGAARVDRELSGQPEVQAAMLALLGSVYIETGALEKAGPLLERSLAIREKLSGPESAETAESLNALGRLRTRQGDHKAARALLERAVRIRERFRPDPALAETLGQLGMIAHSSGRFEESRFLFERAVAVEEKTGGRYLKRWFTNLAAAEEGLGNFPKARELLERALSIGGRPGERSNIEMESMILLNLGSVLCRQEEFDAARPLFERALAIEEKVYGSEHFVVGYALGELGALYAGMGDSDRARDLLERSIAMFERTLSPDHPGMAYPLLSYGRLRLAERKPAEALPFFERAVGILQKKQPGEDHIQVAEGLAGIARARLALEGPAAAEPLLRQALVVQRRTLAAGHPDLVPTLTALGGSAARLGRAAEARLLLEEAVSIARARLPQRHSQRLAAEGALRDLSSVSK